MKRGKLTLAVNGFNGMACSSADIKDVDSDVASESR